MIAYNFIALIIWLAIFIPVNLFIIFVFFKNIIRRKITPQQPAYLSAGEDDIFDILRFVEQNPLIYAQDNDEGFGTIYERLVMNDFLRGIQNRHNVKSVLEFPADGITGIPGINSIEFAKDKGSAVYLVSPSQKLLDKSSIVWHKAGLDSRVKFIKSVIPLPFDDNFFDLVWNFCMFDRFSSPQTLVKEMSRVSRKLVLVVTQNYYNFGTPLHKIYHRAKKIPWDHGYKKNMALKGLTDTFRRSGIKIIETGALDIPATMDTWDMPLRGELRKLMALFGKKWEWKMQDAEDSHNVSALHRFFIRIERKLPVWFKKFQAHHLFALGEVKK